MKNAVAERNIQVNDLGYLTDFSQWDREVGLNIALQSGIEMTDHHWKVIDFIQDQHKKSIPLTIRKMGKSGVVTIKELYALFPNGPLKVSTKIAGVPKPVGCI